MKTYNLPENLVDDQTTIFWFRRDLRIEDNAGLYYALKEQKNVLPLFIFDSVILGVLEESEDRRVDFIHQALDVLKNKLEKIGSSLLVVHGDPVKILKELTPKAVYTNHDYEPYATRRDEQVKKILTAKGVVFNTFKDQVIFEKNEILKSSGDPYTVFTPYSKKWKEKLTAFYFKSYPTKKYFSNFKKVESIFFPSLQDIGFKKTNTEFPLRTINKTIIRDYHKYRNFPYHKGTSRLGVHIRFGTVSIRALATLAQNENETWLNELIWREFFQMILWHYPHVVTKSFKPAYDMIQWRNDPEEFQAWCKGKTGYPIVDAGMRELNATGFMHNRVRMITASFLTKHLLIDWRWGEAYFAKKLLDYDLAANNGGWQWAASTGCDAAPYFRIFNPELQTQKFDPKHKYINTWIPEINTPLYPKPIVEHQVARNTALSAYKRALETREHIA